MLAEMRDYLDKLRSMDMDPQGRIKAERQINASGITVNNGPVAFSYVPMLLTEDDLKEFQKVVDNIQGILAKMTERYVSDPSYRKIFGFSKEMEELICLPCDYPCIIPYGRYDLFYDFAGGDYSFCEINTDGSGGMSWNDRITDAILENFADQDYLKERGIRCWNATEAFAEGIIDTWKSSPQAYEDKKITDGKDTLVKNPVIAIVDFKEEGVTTDFDGIIDALMKRGVQARFTDVRNLKFNGEQLIDRRDGTVIQAIYRRLVTSVVLERYAECRDLIEAVRANKVVLMGHFRSSLAHSKTVFAAMYRPETMEFLSEEEQDYVKAHVPATYILRDRSLSEEAFQEIRDHRQEWVLKPEEGFGSYGVTCGMDVSGEEWNDILDKALEENYILQRFCNRYTVPVVSGNSGDTSEYPLMLGIFQTNGKAVSCYNRAGRAGVIDYSHGCLCVATARIYTMQDQQQ